MRAEKQTMVEEISRRAGESGFVYLVDLTGLSVERVSELRRRLKAAGSEVHVVRNRLFKRVGAQRGWPGLDEVLRKPTAMVTGRDDVGTARVLREFSRADEKPVAIKGGYLGDAFLGPADVAALAQLPAKPVLQATLVGTLAAPMTRLAGVLSRKVSSLVYVLKAAEKKKSG